MTPTFHISKAHWIIVTLLLFGINSWAQISDTSFNGVNNPFSFYGYGQMEYQGLMTGQMMGRTGAAHNSLFVVNPTNPASYSSIRITTLDFAFAGNNSLTTTTSQKIKSGGVAPKYFYLAFPIGTNAGLAMGIRPYTKSTYRINFADKLTLPDTTLRTSNTAIGKGNLNIMNISGGYDWKGFKIGLDVNYIFGNSTDEKYMNFKDSVYLLGTDNIASYRYSGFGFQLGAQYGIKLDSSKKLNFGLVYGLGSQISARSSAVSTSIFARNTIRLDTFVQHPDQSGTFATPTEIKFGVGYTYLDNLQILVDYRMSNWSNNSRLGVQKNLKSFSMISAGVEYTPITNGLRASTLTASTFRFGFYTGSDYTVVSGAQPQFWGITGGISLPFKRNLGKLHMGVDYSQQGSISTNSLKTRTTTFMLGISFSDKWFQKRYYD